MEKITLKEEEFKIASNLIKQMELTKRLSFIMKSTLSKQDCSNIMYSKISHTKTYIASIIRQWSWTYLFDEYVGYSLSH